MVADRRRNRWFVDSPLERNGFELPVPRENGYRSESSGFVYLPETVRVSSKDLPTSGTEVSNPLPSSGESVQTWLLLCAAADEGWGGIEAVVPELREPLNDNDPSVRAEALAALENLTGKGAPAAELKSLSPTADPAVSPRVA